MYEKLCIPAGCVAGKSVKNGGICRPVEEDIDPEWSSRVPLCNCCCDIFHSFHLVVNTVRISTHFMLLQFFFVNSPRLDHFGNRFAKSIAPPLVTVFLQIPTAAQ